MEATMAQGCPKCGRGTDENPHHAGWAWFVFHELRCWGPHVLFFNMAWLWTHPDDEDERIGDGVESFA